MTCQKNVRQISTQMHPYLGSEICSFLWGIVLGISSHISTPDFLHRHVLNVETNVVTWQSLGQRLVMHFN